MSDGLAYRRGRCHDRAHRLEIDVASRGLERVFLNLLEWLQPADGMQVHLYGAGALEPEVLSSPRSWDSSAISALLRERGRDLILNDRVGLSIAYDLCGAELGLTPDKRLVLDADAELVIVSFERKLAAMASRASIGLTPWFGDRSVEAWRDELIERGFRPPTRVRSRSLIEILVAALRPGAGK